jgi:MFS family permease
MPLLRFVTGMAMAGVYPVGMKLASTWADGDMGLMVGILVGALTLGSASPHLFNALGGVDWRVPVAVASVSALASGLLIFAAGVGPTARPRRASTRAPCSTRGATFRCASPTSATSATCGSSTRCGRGSAFS